MAAPRLAFRIRSRPRRARVGSRQAALGRWPRGDRLGTEAARRRDFRRGREGARAPPRRPRRRVSTSSRSPTVASSKRSRLLLPALRKTRLTPFGRLAAGWDLKRMLSTLLIFAETERGDPAIPTRPLAPPIFIAGLPRSGTTFLHGLLAEDPVNRAPRIWKAIYTKGSAG